MRLINAFLHDMRFQARHGFFVAYLIVCIMYILFLRFLPIEIRPVVLAVIIFSDTSVLGAFFIGGIILLEKEQRIHGGIFTTPLTPVEYIISKAAALTVTAVIMSCLLYTSPSPRDRTRSRMPSSA